MTRATAAATVAVAALMALMALAACPGESAPRATPAPSAEAAAPTVAAPAPRSDRPPRPEPYVDSRHGVRLDLPDASWRILDSMAVAAADSEGVAGLTDGRDCVGIIRAGSPPSGGIEGLARARVDSLGFAQPNLSWIEPVLYLGVTAMRFEVSGERAGGHQGMRVSLAVAPRGDPNRRLYEIRAESTASNYVAARHCFDAVTGAFDVAPITTP